MTARGDQAPPNMSRGDPRSEPLFPSAPLGGAGGAGRAAGMEGKPFDDRRRSFLEGLIKPHRQFIELISSSVSNPTPPPTRQSSHEIAQHRKNHQPHSHATDHGPPKRETPPNWRSNELPRWGTLRQHEEDYKKMRREKMIGPTKWNNARVNPHRAAKQLVYGEHWASGLSSYSKYRRESGDLRIPTQRRHETDTSRRDSGVAESVEASPRCETAGPTSSTSRLTKPGALTYSETCPRPREEKTEKKKVVSCWNLDRRIAQQTQFEAATKQAQPPTQETRRCTITTQATADNSPALTHTSDVECSSFDAGRPVPESHEGEGHKVLSDSDENTNMSNFKHPSVAFKEGNTVAPPTLPAPSFQGHTSQATAEILRFVTEQKRSGTPETLFGSSAGQAHREQQQDYRRALERGGEVSRTVSDERSVWG
eukprot:GHVN01055191.1.p1 GENE.GHVN01055191.1~~GHVN01055191.1.p1  ORF type:complete len:425 (+),score=77.92 GHVN01055191.1:1476-2750(+)